MAGEGADPCPLFVERIVDEVLLHVTSGDERVIVALPIPEGTNALMEALQEAVGGE